MDKMLEAENKTDEAIVSSLQTVIATIQKRIERRKKIQTTPVVGVDVDNEFPVVENPVSYSCPDCGRKIATKARRVWKLVDPVPALISGVMQQACNCKGFWKYGHRNGVVHFICTNERDPHLKYDVSIAEYRRILGCPS